MLTLIRQAKLYSPQEKGVQDILIGDRSILQIAPQVELPPGIKIEVIEASHKIVIPGLIDQHVHIIGGGGEGGPETRVPEITLSNITLAGVTTVVGLLGTDSVTRHMESLLAKALALEREGITTFIYTGAYAVPPPTITGSIKKDLTLIEKVVGVGEIAISDHRSSQPTIRELAKIAAEARVGGMLGGKPGLVHLHVGSGSGGLDPILRIIKETEIPITQFIPTHVSRTPTLLEQAIEFAKRGGWVDITATEESLGWRISAVEAVERMLASGVPLERITISSDGNGSMPIFNDQGQLVRLAVAKIGNLFRDLKRMVKEQGLPLSQALQPFTSNVAKLLKIAARKGSIAEGKDADLLILTENLEIDRVYAKGKLMVSEGKAVVKGTFED